MFISRTNNFVVLISYLIGVKALAVTDDRALLGSLLNQITLSNNGFYNKVISPAKSLNLNLSSSARTDEANKKIANEVGNVLIVFKTAAENNKFESVRKYISSLDARVLSNGGASIQFTDGTPSAALSRTLIMIPKNSQNPRVSAQQLLRSFSSYKRSALPTTTFYEYSNAQNVSQSTINTRAGSEQSWMLPNAAPEVAKNKDLVLKKCRQIFGWKCVTALYKTGDIQSDNPASFLYAGIYDLENNPDHPSFANDKRSTNQITGSTALYVVTESPQWVLIYGVDSQWNKGALSFTSLIENEFLKDLLRIKERISLDMQIPSSELK